LGNFNPLTSQAIDLINELDPAKKNYEWATKSITSLRTYWRPLKNVSQALENRAIMYSMQSLAKVRDSFDDEEFKKNIDFTPLPIMEPLVNSVVEDMCKNPPRAELRAEDPTAVNEKKEDLERLKNRGILERDRTELQKRVFGEDSQYKMPYGKFKGNVQDFDEMGLDENDPDDVNFYEKNFQRLWFEIGGQSLLNNVLKTNQFDKSTLRKLVKDIFWAKAICVDAAVDQITGEIKYKYIDPQIARGIFGESNDGKDDVCRGWEDSVTLSEFLQRIGNDFDWDKCWKHLLWGINYCNNLKFTGFIRGGVTYDCCGDPQWMDRIGCGGVEASSVLDWSMAHMYKVYLGRIQWKTIEATSTKLLNSKDSSYLEYVPYSYELKKKKIKEGYDKQSNYQQQWYESYYLATSVATQYLYKFQKVYYQRITGANDEYSNGTLCYYQEEGKSAVEISKVYIQTANFTFYRMLWVIYKAKPDPDEYIWEELLQLAQTTQRQFNQNNPGSPAPAAGKGFEDVLNNIIKQMRAKHVRIRTYPRIDGKPVQQIAPIEKKGSGGLDPIAISMQAVTMWAEQQIAQKIGINPMRLGQNPPPRESTDSEQATINASFVTTGYMYRMIQYLKEHLAIATLNYAQDIIKYKDSLPYKWIKTILGNESFEALQSLEKFAAHRMGIYVDDYNTEMDRQALKNAADISLQQKTITIIQWGIITQTNNPKLGFKILAHLELKTKKKERKQALQDQEITNAMNKNLHTMKMEELGFDRETKWGIADREGAALVESAKIQAGARVEVKNLQNQAEAPKQAAKAEGDIEVERSKKELEEQESFKA
jgi:hypothetical protein